MSFSVNLIKWSKLWGNQSKAQYYAGKVELEESSRRRLFLRISTVYRRWTLKSPFDYVTGKLFWFCVRLKFLERGRGGGWGGNSSNKGLKWGDKGGGH